MKNEDGGYFGLKGYSFQYVVSMQKILTSENNKEYIELEQIEDLGTKKELIQVKYKEKSIFSPSSIRKPVMKLMDEMEADDRELMLYCYFDKLEETKFFGNEIQLDTPISLTVDLLEIVLGSSKNGYQTSKKKEFVSKFTIFFTKRYDEKFQEAINIIQNTYSCEEDLALVYYSQFMHHIIEKVVSNDTLDYKKRKCSKVEFDSLVNKTNKAVVIGHLENILGKEKYYKIVKKQFNFNSSPDNIEKIFAIDVNERDSVDKLFKIAKEISNKFYVRRASRGKERIDSPAPYIYFSGISSSQLVSLKSKLYMNNYYLLDGYPFLGSDFSLSHITQKTKVKTTFKLKIINDSNSMEKIMEKFLEENTALEVYVLYRLDNIKVTSGNNIYYTKVKISNLEDITDYLIN